MKKEFLDAALEVVRLEKKDIIATSNPMGVCTGTDSCGATDTCSPEM